MMRFFSEQLAFPHMVARTKQYDHMSTKTLSSMLLFETLSSSKLVAYFNRPLADLQKCITNPPITLELGDLLLDYETWLGFQVDVLKMLMTQRLVDFAESESWYWKCRALYTLLFMRDLIRWAPLEHKYEIGRALNKEGFGDFCISIIASVPRKSLRLLLRLLEPREGVLQLLVQLVYEPYPSTVQALLDEGMRPSWVVFALLLRRKAGITR